MRTPDQGGVLAVRGCAPTGPAVVEATTDGGASWSQLGSPPLPAGHGVPGQAGFSGIYFADALDGYVFGPSLATTQDGGRHWSVSGMAGVTEVAGGDGVAYTLVAPVDGPLSAIWRSPTGTDRWVQARLPQPGPVEALPPQLHVRGSRLVLLAPGYSGPGDSGPVGAIGVSDNGGGSWQEQKVPCQRPADGGAAIMTVALGHAAAWLVDCFNNEQSSQAQQTQHHLYGTADAGRHWIRLSDPATTGAPGLLADNGAGRAFVVVVGGGGALLSSSLDGGRTWHQSLQSPSDSNLFSYNNLDFVSPTTGYLQLPPLGPLYHTVDGGIRWTPMSGSGWAKWPLN